MKVVLALALLTGANAVCTIKDVSTYVGIVGDSSAGKTACSGTTLANGQTCDVKCDTGYACSHATATATCPPASDTATYTTLATTGCYTGFHQSTDALKAPETWGAAIQAAGTAGTCLACAADTTLAGAAFANSAPASSACVAGCTYVDLDNIVGFEPDYGQSNPACVGGLMPLSTSCAIKLSDGYADATAGTTLVHQCGGTAGVVGDATGSTAATAGTTGCATGYVQSTDALKTVQPAAGPAVAATAVGTCVACASLGQVVTQATFAGSATACPDCTLTSMGSAGKCTGGCPVDTYQSAVGTSSGASVTCTACDPTKYIASTAAPSAIADAAEVEATVCGAKGCRPNYYQTAGTPTVTAVTGSDSEGTCTEKIQSTATAATCLPKEPGYTAICAAAVMGSASADSKTSDKANCDAVKAYKADGTVMTGATDLACTFTEGKYVAEVTTGCTGKGTKTLCAGVKTNDVEMCDWTPSTDVAAVATAVDIGCTKCPAGKTAPGITSATGVAAGSYAACVACNPYAAGDCSNGCPADFYQTNTASNLGGFSGIRCLPCAAGKTLAAAGVQTTAQTAASCTTPAAAASGAFRSVANAAATAVAASFAAAALM